MSPEQAAGRPIAEASDWYGVGVMLFEALVGQRPFADALSSQELLARKQSAVQLSPADWVTGIPET